MDATRNQQEMRNQFLFRREELKSEKLINYARGVISFLYLAAGLGIRDQIPEHSFHTVCAAAGASLAYSLFLHYILRFRKYNPLLKYITSFIDITILSLAIYSFGTFRTFKTEAFLLYFLWIGLAAMRFSVRLTLLTGLWSFICYSLIIGLGIHFKTIEIGSITDSFTTHRVSPANLGLRMLFMLSFFLTASYVARAYQRIMIRAVEGETQILEEMGEKLKVSDTLARYISPEIADKVMEEGVNFQGEKRTAVILFCDIRNFTAMAENLPPEGVVTFLNEYLGSMIDVIFKNGGTLDKFVGDQIMAVFGAPVSHENDVERAVLTALEMKDKLAHLNRERESRGLDPMEFGIGIHAGEVIAGNIGSEKRTEYTVIGAAVNLASRVESLNKNFRTDILITEEAYREVSSLIEVEKQEPAMLKGITGAVQTYRILSLASGKTRADA